MTNELNIKNCTKCGVSIDKFTLCEHCFKVLNENIKIFGVRDYQDYVSIDASPEERQLYNIGDIWRNEIECKHCGDQIRSKNGHNFVMCKCGKVGVDGGSYYSRLIGDSTDYICHIEYFKNLKKE